jgi:hypothetical protein
LDGRNGRIITGYYWILLREDRNRNGERQGMKEKDRIEWKSEDGFQRYGGEKKCK